MITLNFTLHPIQSLSSFYHVSLHFRLNNSLSTRSKTPLADESKSKLVHATFCNNSFHIQPIKLEKSSNNLSLFFFLSKHVCYLKYACWRVFSRKVKCHSEYNPTRKPIILPFPLVFWISLYSLDLDIFRWSWRESGII